MCYTKIPKNTGILFSKIPVSVFESNPGIPVFSGIPQGPGHQWIIKGLSEGLSEGYQRVIRRLSEGYQRQFNRQLNRTSF